jgi:hypothetical protein
MVDPNATTGHVALAKLIEDALRACGWDTSKARTLVRKTIDEDLELYKRVADPLIDSGITHALQAALSLRRATRASFTDRTAKPRVEQAKEDYLRLSSLANGSAEDLMGWEIGSGKSLGDATKEEIEAAAQRQLRTADTIGRRGRWLRLIASRLARGETPRSAGLTEADLQQMADSVSGLF